MKFKPWKILLFLGALFIVFGCGTLTQSEKAALGSLNTQPTPDLYDMAMPLTNYNNLIICTYGANVVSDGTTATVSIGTGSVGVSSKSPSKLNVNGKDISFWITPQNQLTWNCP